MRNRLAITALISRMHHIPSVPSSGCVSAVIPAPVLS